MAFSDWARNIDDEHIGVVRVDSFTFPIREADWTDNLEAEVERCTQICRNQPLHELRSQEEKRAVDALIAKLESLQVKDSKYRSPY